MFVIILRLMVFHINLIILIKEHVQNVYVSIQSRLIGKREKLF